MKLNVRQHRFEHGVGQQITAELARISAPQDKPGFVAAASAAVAQALSKPESYVAVCVTDEHDGMSFGGTNEPCAVGFVYSIGSINQVNAVHPPSHSTFPRE